MHKIQLFSAGQRLKIYKEALINIDKYKGLCRNFNAICWKLGVNSPDVLTYFPEVYLQRPEKMHLNSQFWFNPNDTKTRKLLLCKAIGEVKKIITNKK